MRIINFIKKEAVLSAATLLAVISMFFVPPDTEYLSYINFRVLCLLFSLMFIVAGMRKLGALDALARALSAGCASIRSLVLTLTLLCFFLSMLITNDVALLTLVPLTITVLNLAGGEEYTAYTVVLQTIAANLGSMLTPMGNPQNLYLSDFYNMSAGEFFSAIGPVWAVSGVIVLLLALPVKPHKIKSLEVEPYRIENKRLFMSYIILSALALAAVFNTGGRLYILLTAAVALWGIIFDRTVFKRVDWLLLLTFVMFFVFVGNAARLKPVADFMSGLTEGREILAGAFLSQLISNVPAAVMLSSFTHNGRELMVGVDIGGLGTPIASLASLISYRLYCASEKCNKAGYMRLFLSLNFALLIILILFCTVYY